MMSQDNRLMPMPAVERGLDRPLTDVGPVRSYGPAATEPNQLRDYLFVVLKRKWLIISLCLVVTSLVAVQMFRQPSIYEAETTIRIEQRQQMFFKPKTSFSMRNLTRISGAHRSSCSKSGSGETGRTESRPATQSKLLWQRRAGRSLQRAATNGLGRKNRRHFPPKLRVALGDWGSATAGDPLSPEELSALEPYEDAIIGAEKVEGIVGTNLFNIKFRHTDPEMAQKVANALAEVFQRKQHRTLNAELKQGRRSSGREIAAFRKRSVTTRNLCSTTRAKKDCDRHWTVLSTSRVSACRI